MSNSEEFLSKIEIIIALFTCIIIVSIAIFFTWLIGNYNETVYLKQENCINCCMLKCSDNNICVNECFKLCNDYEIYRQECYNHPNMTLIEKN